MTAKVEVQYKDGHEEVLPVPNTSIETLNVGEYIWIGGAVLISLKEIHSIVIHDDVPDSEDADESEDSDDADSDPVAMALEQIAEAVREAVTKHPTPLVPNPNPYDKHYPWVYWGWGKTETWPSGRITMHNTTAEGSNTNLSGYFEGSAESYTCKCKDDFHATCTKHPYGYYL